MTSVPQLPVESAPPNALPKGEASLGRSNKPTDERGEGGFAAVLAQALPERRQAAKAELADESKSLQVEGEGTPAEELERAAVPDAEETAWTVSTLKVEKVEAQTFVAQVALVVVPEGLPAEALTELGEKLASTAATLEQQPAAALAEERTAEEAFREAEIVEVDDAASRDESAHTPERSAQVRGIEAAEARPAAKANEEIRTVERPHEPPSPVALKQPALAHTDQATREIPAQPQKHVAPQAPGVESAAEPRRIVEAPNESKIQPPRADEVPVIDFRVRSDAAAQNTRHAPETTDWTRTLQSKPAEATPKSGPPPPAAEQPAQAPPAPESVLKVPPRTSDGRAAVAATKEIKPSPSRPTEHGDVRRAVTQTVAPAPQGDESRDGAQAGRISSTDAPDPRDESPDGKATPGPQTASFKRNPASVSDAPPADADTPKQVPLKAVVAAPPAAHTSTTQMTAQANIPAEPSPARPPEEARPVASVKPPSEPEIAAKLQQQSGRTTLSVVLQDERLGRVALQLVERGGWIETAIRASDARTAQTLANGAAALFEALQQRGLALAAGGGASSAWDASDGQRRDNPQRDQESQRRRFRLRRNAGEFEGALARAEL